jgi:hypothetical protein
MKNLGEALSVLNERERRIFEARRSHGGCSNQAVDLRFHMLVGRIYDDKEVQERIVRRIKLDWMIVRPAILTNVLPG